MLDFAVTELKAPFPYFGGKSRAASLVWSRLGDVSNYVEPFAGSLAVILNRPHAPQTETVNDKDGFIANFWRAIQHDSETVAHYADQPVNECDLHARHIWLVERREALTRRLEGDPDYYDAKVAGWWVWGISCWIGSGWCKGGGPWQAVEDAEGFRQLVHLGNQGQGVNRQLVHLGDQGQGVNRKRVSLGQGGRGVNGSVKAELVDYFYTLRDRLRNVRVCCGDWKRVTGPSVTFKHGLTGVLLDPPYSNEERAEGLYTEDCGSVATEVREWAIKNGNNKLLRIAVCGYEGEHQFPENWECVSWHARGGYGGQNQDRDNENRKRERIWFSPNCLKGEQPGLFGDAA
jgi:site-specific DNA-adenine methylase